MYAITAVYTNDDCARAHITIRCSVSPIVTGRYTEFSPQPRLAAADWKNLTIGRSSPPRGMHIRVIGDIVQFVCNNTIVYSAPYELCRMAFARAHFTCREHEATYNIQRAGIFAATGRFLPAVGEHTDSHYVIARDLFRIIGDRTAVIIMLYAVGPLIHRLNRDRILDKLLEYTRRPSAEFKAAVEYYRVVHLCVGIPQVINLLSNSDSLGSSSTDTASAVISSDVSMECSIADGSSDSSGDTSDGSSSVY